MLDPKLLRNNPQLVEERFKVRRFAFDADAFLKLEAQRKEMQVESERLQNERNRLSKAIGLAKQAKEPVDHLLKDVEKNGFLLKEVLEKFQNIQNEMEKWQTSLPNLPHVSVPRGMDENENVEVRKVGQIPTFIFTPKDHMILGELKQRMDFNTAAKISGSRFVVLRSEIARLHRGLIQFMLDIHTKEHGYQEIYVPYLVNREALFGTGQLPNLEEDLFFCTPSSQYGLIPTAEVPLTNLVRDLVLSEDKLPLRFVAHSPCFRSEAGSYGKDVQGMMRHHQFEKVELVQIVHPDFSEQAHEELTRHAEMILKRLNLPYRVVLLCGGDLGFTSAKTYDLEVWLPSQERYREISSCSLMESFQARRMQARFKKNGNNQTEYVHTLNGSGLAVGRTLIAILENFQDEKGNIHIPEALQPYLDDQKILNLE